MEIFHIFLAITMLGIAAYALQIAAIQKTFRRTNTDDGKDAKGVPDHAPPVSVLKPLKGLDDNLFDNCESICLQDYPEYEIIFSLQDHNDPAYHVVRKIKEKHADKDITILVEPCDEGLNPKVNNLLPALQIARYEHILVSDSNVMVDRNYLKSIIQHTADPNVGLVSNIIAGVGGKSLGSVLENLHLNSFIIGSVCLLDKFLKMPCVVGKSMLMKKSDLQAIGGLVAVKDVLAEDYVIGKKMHKQGKKVILSKHVIKNVNEYWGMRRFLNRHTRWSKMRWKIAGASYISELVCNPVCTSFAPIMLGEISRFTISFALAVSILKILGDLWIRKILMRHEGETSRHNEARNTGMVFLNPLMYGLVPLKDLLIGLIWFVPLVSDTVVWRGNRYLIKKDSVLAPCSETGLFSWKYRIFDAIRARLA